MILSDMKAGDTITTICGEVIILEIANSRNVLVRFLNTGYEKAFTAGNIRKGLIKDPMRVFAYGVGFLGGDVYNSTNSKIAYIKWHSMLQRCYSESERHRNKTYAGVTVSKEWHNFQNFAEWFYENYPNDGQKWHLDKDDLSGSRKIYSPSTCKFVSSQENSEISLSSIFTLADSDGNNVELRNVRKFCRENKCNKETLFKLISGKTERIGDWYPPNL